jgi:hypothetical protein
MRGCCHVAASDSWGLFNPIFHWQSESFGLMSNGRQPSLVDPYILGGMRVQTCCLMNRRAHKAWVALQLPGHDVTAVLEGMGMTHAGVFLSAPSICSTPPSICSIPIYLLHPSTIPSCSIHPLFLVATLMHALLSAAPPFYLQHPPSICSIPAASLAAASIPCSLLQHSCSIPPLPSFHHASPPPHPPATPPPHATAPLAASSSIPACSTP